MAVPEPTSIGEPQDMPDRVAHKGKNHELFVKAAQLPNGDGIPVNFETNHDAYLWQATYFRKARALGVRCSKVGATIWLTKREVN